MWMGGMLEALCKSCSGSGLGSMALHTIPGGQRQRPDVQMVPSPDFVFFLHVMCFFLFLLLFFLSDLQFLGFVFVFCFAISV